MNPGDRFALMLIQNGSLRELANDPSIIWQLGKLPLFSIPEANPALKASLGQMVRVDSNGTYAVEDVPIGWSNSDRDYNDLIFQIKGAKNLDPVLPPIAQYINPQKDWRNTTSGKQLLDYSHRPYFDRGTFVVGESGRVKVNFLFDGSQDRGEVGIFSLSGFDTFKVGSTAFCQEAVKRVQSNSKQGYIVTKDLTEGAFFSLDASQGNNYNDGVYQGDRTFNMNPGDTFGIVFTKTGTLADALTGSNGTIGDRLFFSLFEANRDRTVQVAEVFASSKGAVIGLEDVHLSNNSDRDYDDLVISLEGVKPLGLPTWENTADQHYAWIEMPVGQNIINYFNNSSVIAA
jgi:hypothetical protein